MQIRINCCVERRQSGLINRPAGQPIRRQKHQQWGDSGRGCGHCVWLAGRHGNTDSCKHNGWLPVCQVTFDPSWLNAVHNPISGGGVAYTGEVSLKLALTVSMEKLKADNTLKRGAGFKWSRFPSEVSGEIQSTCNSLEYFHFLKPLYTSTPPCSFSSTTSVWQL